MSECAQICRARMDMRSSRYGSCADAGICGMSVCCDCLVAHASLVMRGYAYARMSGLVCARLRICMCGQRLDVRGEDDQLRASGRFACVSNMWSCVSYVWIMYVRRVRADVRDVGALYVIVRETVAAFVVCCNADCVCTRADLSVTRSAPPCDTQRVCAASLRLDTPGAPSSCQLARIWLRWLHALWISGCKMRWIVRRIRLRACCHALARICCALAGCARLRYATRADMSDSSTDIAARRRARARRHARMRCGYVSLADAQSCGLRADRRAVAGCAADCAGYGPRASVVRLRAAHVGAPVSCAQCGCAWEFTGTSCADELRSSVCRITNAPRCAHAVTRCARLRFVASQAGRVRIMRWITEICAELRLRAACARACAHSLRSLFAGVRRSYVSLRDAAVAAHAYARAICMDMDCALVVVPDAVGAVPRIAQMRRWC